VAVRPILVLHDLGDPAGGSPWRDAIAATGWRGLVLAPDLPGHASAPAPPGGAYDLADPVLAAVRTLPAEAPAPVVIGVGLSGWSAWLLGLGGRAAAVVLVDGLGGPWQDPTTVVAAGRERLRAMADDLAATGPPPAGGPDPRLAHGVPPQSSRDLAVRAAAAMPVPVMVVETPGSPVDAEDAIELVGGFAGGATLVEMSERAPSVVAPGILAWAELGGHLDVVADG
jgi:pimeloyl-ACP methyl ester carboxylesterase